MITVVHCTKLELTVIQVAVTQRERERKKNKKTAEYLWIHLQCTYNMKEEILTE